MEIQPGDKVIVVDAFGVEHERRALTGVVPAHDFDVVWACRENEWETAVAEGRQPEGVPWPVEDVRPAANAPA